jgi:hypothetical protein
VGEPNLVSVRTCQGLLLGEMYKSKLEAMGIPVLLKYDAAGPVFGITVDGLGKVRILVPSELADEARSLLDDLSDEELADPQAEGE